MVSIFREWFFPNLVIIILHKINSTITQLYKKSHKRQFFQNFFGHNFYATSIFKYIIPKNLKNHIYIHKDLCLYKYQICDYIGIIYIPYV